MNGKLIENVGRLSLQSFIQGMDAGEAMTESLLLSTFEKMGMSKDESEAIIEKMKCFIKDKKHYEADKFSTDIVSALQDALIDKGADNE